MFNKILATRQMVHFYALKLAAAIGLLSFTACSTLDFQTELQTKPQNNINTTSATEVRGTWVTTTANDAIAHPANTAKTMRRLREIGLNTVYVEVWKNGNTQFPSEVLRRAVGAIGVDSGPVLATHDQRDNQRDNRADNAGVTPQKTPLHRDLLQETLIEAHRNGLLYIAWFEYGFMAAHKDSMPLLRKQKPEWLSRDISGNEVAPNGFVWMNPLHPEVRKLLLDLVLEAVDRYDLDGVQLDDRIVWPHITMGYDDYTKKVYASEHNGREPPKDYNDAEWMRWRADKLNKYAKLFVQEVRAKRGGLVLSLSPAVYPWSWQNYLLDWPKWRAWNADDRLPIASPLQTAAAKNITQITPPHWDEFIPQVYRFSYPAFEKTWLAQIDAIRTQGAARQNEYKDEYKDLIAGIRIVGDGQDSSWEQLRDSILLARHTGGGGHVLWFSRGVLDVYAKELTDFYQASGAAASPHFPRGWRKRAITLYRAPLADEIGIGVGIGIGNAINNNASGRTAWFAADLAKGRYRMIAFNGHHWQYLNEQKVDSSYGINNRVYFYLSEHYQQVELLVDRREEMRHFRRDLYAK